MHLLIVKHGALGDVVRTSYFASPLRRKWGPKLRLSWITALSSLPLLRGHPEIDDLWTDFGEANSLVFDHVYSLDDELDVLENVARLATRGLTGARLSARGEATYTQDSAEWFDMGLLSVHGKARADQLKKLNTKSHAEIFARMFEVDGATPEFFGNAAMEASAAEWIGASRPVVGINPYAGGRWPSKELPDEELRKLIRAVLDGSTHFGAQCQLVLIGAGVDRTRNLALAKDLANDRVRVADTDESPLRLAALVKQLDHLISSDSLAMHLAIAQNVPTLAFFAPTSAIEIDGFGRAAKLISTAPDYCSYRRDANNASITAERLLSLLRSA